MWCARSIERLRWLSSRLSARIVVRSAIYSKCPSLVDTNPPLTGISTFELGLGDVIKYCAVLWRPMCQSSYSACSFNDRGSDSEILTLRRTVVKATGRQAWKIFAHITHSLSNQDLEAISHPSPRHPHYLLVHRKPS
jgi:hypothetical protein